MKETFFLMNNADRYRLTAIRTYAVLFLVELSNGNGLLASSYLRLAIKLLIAKQTIEQSSKAREVSTWGILT